MDNKYCMLGTVVELHIDVADELLRHAAVGGHPHAGGRSGLAGLLDAMHGILLRRLSCNTKTFSIYPLRSGSESEGKLATSATKTDNRNCRIGKAPGTRN